MPPLRTFAVSVIGIFLLIGALFSRHQARAEQPPPSLVGDEMHRVQSDFAAGGIRRLSANWNACVDQARDSQDANVAERCVVYGYGALLLSDSNGAVTRTPWMRHLTEDIVTPGQFEMLAIMGIPDGPRQAWLDRYRRWVTEDHTLDNATQQIVPADSETPRNPNLGAPYGGITYRGTPRLDAPYGGAPDARPTNGDSRGDDGETDLARMADGKYPREVLRQPAIADALRQLLGASLFSHLRAYDFGNPMEFTGQFTVGAACESRACGVSEVRYVFAPDDVWIGIVDGGRLRLYGNPPRPARALLLRGRNQTVWRGPIDDGSHPISPPPVPLTAEPVTSVQAPRMSISPRLIPVSADPAPQVQPDGDTTVIRLRNHDGTLVVPVLINNTVTAPFTIDSGASDVSVSSELMEKLIQSGTVSRADFLGKQVYHLADGSAVSSDTFRIHVLKVGDREVHDVMGSVTNDADSLLLGQSFLTRFRSWSIDNQRQVLLLK
jgi:predicted aspartyl protease